MCTRATSGSSGAILLTDEPADVRATAQAVVDAQAGLGTITSYATEVALPATGTWSNPGRGGAQADIVTTAPENGVPTTPA